MFEMFNLMFTIVPIIIFCGFVFVIAMFVSPKLRGYFMSRQVKSLKHMTDYSKNDLEDIKTNLANANIRSEKKIIKENEETLKDLESKKADIESISISKKTKAFKEAISDNIYCKYCGTSIDNDSIFCKKCGKEQ